MVSNGTKLHFAAIAYSSKKAKQKKNPTPPSPKSTQPSLEHTFGGLQSSGIVPKSELGVKFGYSHECILPGFQNFILGVQPPIKK